MERRELIARWLWTHDGLPEKAFGLENYAPAHFVCVKPAAGASTAAALNELRDLYLKHADELIAQFDADVPADVGVPASCKRCGGRREIVEVTRYGVTYAKPGELNPGTRETYRNAPCPECVPKCTRGDLGCGERPCVCGSTLP